MILNITISMITILNYDVNFNLNPLSSAQKSHAASNGGMAARELDKSFPMNREELFYEQKSNQATA